ncbi:amidase [Cohnella lubricantis]|uniref:Amidase n=1 Tax=Cohnella lubricantis TaxID=2163172 RepID=A0A841TD49_9BACL|nr:amidase [Cohnella lubricantis]MBB6676381.1 amidase [Cohnella lubricantis]MBP2117612.1 amidase [Cohnella lubricantis]
MFAQNAYIRKDLTVEPEAKGNLDELTFAVKDVFQIKGHTNTAGNPDWHRTHPPASRHAHAVELLIRSGARLRGATVTDEIMYSLLGENYHYGTPVNPKAIGRIPGGSSSGSASAVAAGDADFALGTDTGGSVRVPSSYCGLFGFRPTHGAVSAEGVIKLADSFDTVGWMSRDAKTLLQVGKVLLDSQTIADEGEAFEEVLQPEEAWTLAEPEAGQVLEEHLRSLAAHARVAKPNWPKEGLNAWAALFREIQGIEIWREHGAWVRETKPAFGPGIAERFEWASTLDGSKLNELHVIKRQIAQGVVSLLGRHKLLSVPTAAGEAPPLGMAGEEAELQRSRTMKLTCIAGLAGLPQVTIPFVSKSGYPIGLSFIAGPGRDLALLNWINSRFGERERQP